LALFGPAGRVGECLLLREERKSGLGGPISVLTHLRHKLIFEFPQRSVSRPCPRYAILFESEYGRAGPTSIHDLSTRWSNEASRSSFTLNCGAAAWPIAARAQRSRAMLRIAVVGALAQMTLETVKAQRGIRAGPCLYEGPTPIAMTTVGSALIQRLRKKRQSRWSHSRPTSSRVAPVIHHLRMVRRAHSNRDGAMFDPVGARSATTSTAFFPQRWIKPIQRSRSQWCRPSSNPMQQGLLECPLRLTFRLIWGERAHYGDAPHRAGSLRLRCVGQAAAPPSK